MTFKNPVYYVLQRGEPLAFRALLVNNEERAAHKEEGS